MNFAHIDADVSDAELVAAAAKGSRDAFAAIVSRYQSLVCSVAYSATGNLSLSEDLAQEAFLAAWKQLRQLREPERLRPWLCGIARNLSANSLRRRERDPVAGAGLIGETNLEPARESSPADQAVTNEEAALLWQSLERIPEIYREPMVLFYREQRSVKNVAELLDLSEEAAKQRLSRGRKLLHEQVLGLVETVLERSTPGRAFTVGILASLPVYGATSTATAATVSSAGSAGLKAAGIIGLSGAILGPLVGILGAAIGFKASLADAESERERRFVVRTGWVGGGMIAAFVLVLFGLIHFGGKAWADRPVVLAVAVVAATSIYAASLLALILFFNRHQLLIRAEERAAGTNRAPGRSAFLPLIYCSRRRFLGLPLVCIRMTPGESDTAVGWIAIGGRAFGGLLAFGTLAVAPISFGAVSVGILGLGGLAVGLCTWGGMTLGVWATGGVAIGYLAFGGVALGWEGAMGGVALAREFALGEVAQAMEVNNTAAQTLAAGRSFFALAARLMAWGWVVCVVPIAFFASYWLKAGRDGEAK